MALMNIADTYAKEPQGTPTTDLSKRLERLARYIDRCFIDFSLINSRSDIGQLSKSVDNKLGRSSIAKAAQSRIDVGDIKTLAGAIASILDIFHVRSIIS